MEFQLYIETVGNEIVLLESEDLLIGHFRVIVCLSFKTRPGAQPFV